MKVLIVGGGGREHAIAWKLAESPLVDKLYSTPGNAGLAAICETIPAKASDVSGVADFAESNSVDLTVIGPESPLIAGMADELAKRGLKVFGPSAEAAQIEGSKHFAKELMKEAGVPTAGFESFDDAEKACDYIDSPSCAKDVPIVVKADGEAAGKGVFICKSADEAKSAVDTIMRKRIFGASGDRVIIEEYLDGPEATFMCFVSGTSFLPMVPSQDHKRAYDNDEGPNTGGMGCYSPVPAFTDEIRQATIEQIVRPTLSTLSSRGIHYCGVLYTGLALTSKGPKVVEFNCRFGDPETQVVLPLLGSDLAQIILDCCDNSLDETAINWYDKSAICVVMASGGYPGDYEKGKVISGIDEAEAIGAHVFHAGTDVQDEKLVTSGGRVLGVTALGDTFRSSRDVVYDAVSKIGFEGAHYRNDIGARVL